MIKLTERVQGRKAWSMLCTREDYSRYTNNFRDTLKPGE